MSDEAVPVEVVPPGAPEPAPEPVDDVAVLTPMPAPVAAEVEEAPVEEPEPEARRVLRVGDRGEDVRAAQAQLGAFESGLFDARFLNFWHNYQAGRGVVDVQDELNLDSLPADVPKEPPFKG